MNMKKLWEITEMMDKNDLIHKAMPRDTTNQIIFTMNERIQKLMEIIGNPSTCRGCGDPIWWITTKYKKAMPLNNDLTLHFASCPEARKFRKKKVEEKDEKAQRHLL